MSDYDVEIDGKYNLIEINLAITGEEAGGSEFIKSRVDDSATEKTNIATFRELPPGKRPKPLTVVKQGDPQPPGTKEIWSGKMVVQGTETSVTAYRKV